MLSNKGENLVFLLGLPRSGSTLLSLLIGSHSAIYCPPEPWFLLKLSNFTRQTSSDSPYDVVLTSIGTTEFLQPDIFIEAARAFATKAYNMQLSMSGSGRTIFVDKTPRYYHILSFIDKLFPEARKIWLKRNPLDIASSYQNKWSISVDEITGEKITPYTFDFASGLFHLEAFFDKSSDLKFEMQYEELVKDTRHSLTKVCDFLNLRFEEEMLSYAQNKELIALHRSSIMGDKTALHTHTPHTNSIGQWIEKVAIADLQKIADLLGFDIFSRMGYGKSVDALQKLGVKPTSEKKGYEARRRIESARLDKLTDIGKRLPHLSMVDQLIILKKLMKRILISFASCVRDRMRGKPLQ